MKGFDAFPGAELTIKRLCKRDEMFAAVWSDYQDAWNALRFWQNECTSSAERVDDYRTLVAELEREIGDLLRRLEQ